MPSRDVRKEDEEEEMRAACSSSASVSTGSNRKEFNSNHPLATAV